MSQKIINITSNSSKDELKKLLEKEANKIYVGLRYFAGDILEQALMHKELFNLPLENPKPEGGQHITCLVSPEAKIALASWAKVMKRPQGRHCAFILEKWLELKSKDELPKINKVEKK